MFSAAPERQEPIFKGGGGGEGGGELILLETMLLVPRCWGMSPNTFYSLEVYETH